MTSELDQSSPEFFLVEQLFNTFTPSAEKLKFVHRIKRLPDDTLIFIHKSISPISIEDSILSPSFHVMLTGPEPEFLFYEFLLTGKSLRFFRTTDTLDIPKSFEACIHHNVKPPRFELKRENYPKDDGYKITSHGSAFVTWLQQIVTEEKFFPPPFPFTDPPSKTRVT